MSTRTRGSTSSWEATGTREHELGPCKLDNCRIIQTTIKLRNGKRLESRYCHKHTCKVGWGCEKPVLTSHTQYCKKHQTCAEVDCESKAGDLAECASKWYCPKHECRTQGCHKPRYPSHTHSPPPMPVPPPMPQVIKCFADNCDHPSLPGIDFCGNHKCLIPNCPDGQHFPNGRCVVHQPCQAPACQEFGRWNAFRKQAERFCWQHEKCAMLTCVAVVGADDVLCPMHKCGLGGCKAEKYVWETKSNWCRVHTCGTKDCPNPIENREYPPAMATSILFRHCKEHTCNRPNCLNEAAVQNGPCARHSCAAPDCNHNVYEPHVFCRNHECRDEDCIEESSPEPHVQFCTERHACRWLNDGASCDKPREMFGPYPDFCGFHSHRQSELNGAERGRREAEEQARTEAAASGAPPTPETTPPRSHDNRSRQEEYRRRKRSQHERQRSPDWASDDFSDGDPRYPPYQRQYGRWD